MKEKVFFSIQSENEDQMDFGEAVHSKNTKNCAANQPSPWGLFRRKLAKKNNNKIIERLENAPGPTTWATCMVTRQWFIGLPVCPSACLLFVIYWTVTAALNMSHFVVKQCRRFVVVVFFFLATIVYSKPRSKQNKKIWQKTIRNILDLIFGNTI